MSPSYSKIINEYLTNSDIKSIDKDYPTEEKNTNTQTFEQKNVIISDFFYSDLRKILSDYFGFTDIQKIKMLGSGTQGFVIGFEPKYCKFEELSGSRKKGPYFGTSNKLALKIQLINTNNSSYWEKRMIREEYIIHYLNELSDRNNIKDSIPLLYYGCTYKFNANKFRLTFMELIDPEEYITIGKILSLENLFNSMISDKVYQNIEKIIGTLWKLKVSHNDLSINNIMIGKNGNIKLLDFGLSEILNKPINNAQEYQELFTHIKKDEQSGSNVAKLKELYSLLHRRI